EIRQHCETAYIRSRSFFLIQEIPLGWYCPAAGTITLISSGGACPDRQIRAVSASATILPGDEHMDIVAQLKTERDKAAREANALDTAIRALSGLNSTRATRGRRTMSASARASISASQKAL